MPSFCSSFSKHIEQSIKGRHLIIITKARLFLIKILHCKIIIASQENNHCYPTLFINYRASEFASHECGIILNIVEIHLCIVFQKQLCTRKRGKSWNKVMHQTRESGSRDLPGIRVTWPAGRKTSNRKSILDVNLRNRGRYHNFIPSVRECSHRLLSFLHDFAPCFLNCGNGPKSYIKVRSDHVSWGSDVFNGLIDLFLTEKKVLSLFTIRKACQLKLLYKIDNFARDFLLYAYSCFSTAHNIKFPLQVRTVMEAWFLSFHLMVHSFWLIKKTSVTFNLFQKYYFILVNVYACLDKHK